MFGRFQQLRKFMLLKLSLVLLASLVFTPTFRAAPVYANTDERLLSDVIGVTHSQGKYHFTNQPYLIEGADEIAAMGTSVIKLWFNSRPEENYVYNSDWSQFTLNNLTDLAQTSYYQNVFEREQFKTIILQTYEYANRNGSVEWRDGLSSAEASIIYNEMYNLALHFFQTYANTGKTFILQNWESDGMLDLFNPVTQQPRGLSQQETNARISGMIDWLNVRQNAINDARSAAATLGITGIEVYGAAEVNYIPVGKNYGVPVAIDDVVPYTNMDLYSFSNWKTITLSTVNNFYEILDYIEDKAPDSALFGSKNIFLGEIGVFELAGMAGTYSNWTSETDRIGREIMQRNVELALKWGVRYIVHWQIYCNGLRSFAGYVPTNTYGASDLKGTWLRRSDGSYTGIYNFYKSIMNKTVQDYLGVSEAEAQVTSASGGTVTDYVDVHASGGYITNFNASAAGQHAQFTVQVPQAGTYQVEVGVKTGTTKGRFTLAVNGTNQSWLRDTYGATSQYVAMDMGVVTLSTAGNHTFRFTVAGKHPSSSDFDLAIDYIRLVPSGTLFLETEGQTPVLSTGDTITPFNESYFNGGQGVRLNADAVGDYIQYTLNVPEARKYNIKVRVKKNPSRGIFQLSLNGYNVGSTHDNYSATEMVTDLNLGDYTFQSAGNKNFRFTLTGKNASSSGFELALDSITLTPVD